MFLDGGGGFEGHHNAFLDEMGVEGHYMVFRGGGGGTTLFFLERGITLF